jgi:hypothetical protein
MSERERGNLSWFTPQIGVTPVPSHLKDFHYNLTDYKQTHQDTLVLDFHQDTIVLGLLP